MKNIILTGDRPTGKLHLGHYVGSLKNRVELQNSGKFDEIYIMIADSQALTDNIGNVEKIRQNVVEVALDYLSVGINPAKSTIFLQSQVPELYELSSLYLNFVNVNELERNPTIKDEIKQRNFKKSIPAGFLTYPVSQAADITGFRANVVPVGDDQLPMVELARDIVNRFNNIYGNILIEPNALLPKDDLSSRLPGLDGKAKMSKSLNNCIYLSDNPEEIRKKVMGMYTDPNHLKVSDPGTVENNTVFQYLEVFCKAEHFERYYNQYANLDQVKSHYQKGGLGDISLKEFLNKIIQELLAAIREKRQLFENDIEGVYKILSDGSKIARGKVFETNSLVKKAMGINYFDDLALVKMQKEKYQN